MLTEPRLWEYHAWSMPAWMGEAERLAILGDFGRYGWELVSVEQRESKSFGQYRQHTFKRQILDNSKVEHILNRRRKRSDGYLSPPSAFDD